MSAYGKLKAAIDDEQAYHVEMTRSEARDLIDETEHDGLLEALDNAQGEADASNKVAYVIIKITGERL